MTSDPVDLVLSRVDGARSSGKDQWEARCPAHEDSSPSLSIGRGDKGVLLTCHRGCTLEEITTALDLEARALFYTDEPAPRRSGLGTVERVYPYHDTAGALAFEVVRYRDPKDFRQRRSPEAWSVRGVEPVPYRLPELLEGIEKGRGVFVVEGEKDADRLVSLGLVATCNAGGAGKFKPELVPYFKGANVYILPDNDTPGQRHAEDVARKLEGVAATVRILQLPDLGPVAEKHGADVSDWLDQGHTIDELRSIVAAAVLEPDPDDQEEEEQERLPMPVCALHAPPSEPVRYSVRGIAIQAELGLIVGEGGDGKSSALLALLLAKAGGYPAFGHAAFHAEPAPVLLVSEEDPSGVILNRAEALIDGHGWDRERVLGNFYILALAGATLDSAKWQAHLFAIVEAIRPAIIGLDPLTELTTAEENSNDGAKVAIRFLRKLAHTGASVFVVHHFGKQVEGKRKADRIRGATALAHASRMTFAVTRCDEGMAVECLKFSRGELVPTFVLTREVEVDPENPAEWVRARLSYTAPRVAAANSAEKFVHTTLEESGRLSTTELKDLARGSGNSGQDISAAISSMSARGEIDYEPGPHNSKRWGLSSLPDDSRQPRQPLLAGLPELAGQDAERPQVVAHPFREGNRGQGAGDSRQAAQTYPCASCGSFAFPNPDALCFSCRKREGEGAA